jgi:hypothetical protein
MYGICSECKQEVCRGCIDNCPICPYCRSTVRPVPVERSCAKRETSQGEGGASEGSKGAGPSQPG